MPQQDPYFRSTPLPGVKFIQTSRPITLTQCGSDQAGVVHAAETEDLVVYADVVTIRGPVRVRRPLPDQTGVQQPQATDGGSIVILARQLDALRDGDSKTRSST